MVLADLRDPGDSGTGCVHTAPGHGREDFETGLSATAWKSTRP